MKKFTLVIICTVTISNYSFAQSTQELLNSDMDVLGYSSMVDFCKN
mgnify:CR=1 FL=1